MRNPLALARVFAVWRLNSGGWLYAMLFLGAAGLVTGIALLGLSLAWAVESLLEGQTIPTWPWLVGVGCVGAGLFVLLFEVGLLDVHLTAQKGMRIRQVEGDPEMMKRAAVWKLERDQAVKRAMQR